MGSSPNTKIILISTTSSFSFTISTLILRTLTNMLRHRGIDNDFRCIATATATLLTSTQMNRTHLIWSWCCPRCKRTMRILTSSPSAFQPRRPSCWRQRRWWWERRAWGSYLCNALSDIVFNVHCPTLAKNWSKICENGLDQPCKPSHCFWVIVGSGPWCLFHKSSVNLFCSFWDEFKVDIKGSFWDIPSPSKVPGVSIMTRSSRISAPLDT